MLRSFVNEVRETALKIDIKVVDISEVFRRLIAVSMRSMDTKLGGSPREDFDCV